MGKGMINLFRNWLLLIIALLLAFPARAAESELKDTGHVNARLISSHDVVAPGQSFHIALETALDPHWHTYWVNPGDSGEPVQIDWTGTEQTVPGEMVWPLPDTIATGPLINYIFEGAPLFPVKFTLSDTAVPGDILQIEADAYYLVCKDICIPEGTMLSIQIEVGDPVEDTLSNAVISRALDDAPKLGDISGSVTQTNEDVIFEFSNLPADAALKNVYFFPHQPELIDHGAPQKITKTSDGVRVQTKAGFGWEDGMPSEASGVLRLMRGDQLFGTEVNVTPKQVAAVGNQPTDTQKPGGLLKYVLWAFLGGLILNVMPCVFPIISLKALSIAKMAHGERRDIQRDAWIYTAGIMVSFLILTGVLLGLKESWGFQMQSPTIVGFLALVLFVVGLNLLGLFEFGSRFQGAGQNLTTKSGWTGTFFTGVLAVIVATPCTAPFMATAIGYTLTQPPIITFAIFMALAFGFAFPFLIITYVPGLLGILPKPGTWMVKFKEFLAFPMFAAVIWLVWVVSFQAGETGVRNLLAALLAVGFAVWLFRSGRFSKLLAAAMVIGALVTIYMLHPKEVTYTNSDVIAWSAETVSKHRADGQSVFIDFTAAWCVTCQDNKKRVLDRQDVKQMFKDQNTAFLVADWTSKNDAIKQELARHGRAGVPLYLLYPPGNNDVSPVILPQVLTKSVIENALNDIQ
jgi:thiol:disulfide interchange protein DsbD